jgi:hypothetical protein
MHPEDDDYDSGGRKKSDEGFGCLILVIAALFIIGAVMSLFVKTPPTGRVNETVNPVPPGNGSKNKGNPSKTSPVPPVITEPPPPQTPPNGSGTNPVQEGTLVLKSRAKIISGVEAWVEIDGKRRIEWKVGTDEVQINLPPGRYAVEVNSIYEKVRRNFFSGKVGISKGETTTITVN